TDSNEGLMDGISDGAAGGLGLVAGGAALYLGGALQIGIILSSLTTVALVLGMAFLILIARQMFIIAAVFLAPLAILAWIFPGNDKLWKLWWNMFSKLLMMFPLIMLLIGLGDIFAHLVGPMEVVGIVKVIMILGAVCLPYAAIPFTF